MSTFKQMEDCNTTKRICMSDKLIVQYICINTNCKENRYICVKCIKKHEQHKSDMIQVNDLTHHNHDSTTDLNNQHPFTHSLQTQLFKQTDSLNQVFQFLTSLESAKQKIVGLINGLKNRYLKKLNLKEEMFNPKAIFAAIENIDTPSKHIEEYIDYVVEQNKILSSSLLLDKLNVIPIQQSINSLISTIDSIVQPIDQLAQRIQTLVIPIKVDKDTVQTTSTQVVVNKDSSIEAVRIQMASTQSNNNTNPIVQAAFKADTFIQQNIVYQEMMKPLFSKNINYNDMAKRIDTSQLYTLEFDGCSKGNPGLSGVGFLIKQNATFKHIFEGSVNVGHKTNNQSEYLGLIYGLYVSLKIGISKILVQGDSQLVINQLSGKYKVKSDNLKEYYDLGSQLMIIFNAHQLNHVKRQFNYHADKLSNDALQS